MLRISRRGAEPAATTALELGLAPARTESAPCASVDPDEWFPEDGRQALRAKAICRRCPLRTQCLDDALARGEEYGVWGGLSARERRTLQRDGNGVAA